MPVKPGPSALSLQGSDRPARKPRAATQKTTGTKQPTRPVKTTPRPTPEQRQAAAAAGRGAGATSVEQLLVSSILNHGDMAVAVVAGVTPEMFVGFKDEYAYLHRVYMKHKKPPTIITFRSRFPDFRIVSTADDTAHLAEEIVRIHVQGSMVELMREAVESLRNGSIEDATKSIGSALRTASTSVTVNERDIDLLTDYDEMYADIVGIQQRAADNGGMSGIPWGFPVYDSRTGGAKPGELIVVAARLGQGKTAMLTKWAANALLHDAVVQYDSLEMSRTQMGMRIHSLLSAEMWPKPFNSEDLMLGRLDPAQLDDYRRFLDALKQKIKGKLFVSDNKRGRTTVDSIARQIERNQPDFVAVDYVQLVGKRTNDWQGLGEVSGDLAVLAQESGVPIVIASQLNRTHGLGKDPAGAEAISGADAIGHDAAQIITMKQTSPSTLVVQSVKNRHGRSGMKWHVEFKPGEGKIEECSIDVWEKLKDSDQQASDDGLDV